ncbi:MAG: hypothetical protein IKU36_10120 [Bacteroidales bacterium]|nr:hypothetical protein [Bacteroidales bacterium]
MKRLFCTFLISLSTWYIVSAQDSVPYWLIGKWTDGENVYEFYDSKITVHKDGEYVNEATYTLSDVFVDAIWKDSSNEFYFILTSSIKGVAHEGGDFLERIKHEEYEWMYGKWEMEDTSRDDAMYVSLIITPHYLQAYRVMIDGEGLDVGDMEKTPYEIHVSDATFSNGFTTLDDTFFIDQKNESIFWLYDFDMEMHLTKVD